MIGIKWNAHYDESAVLFCPWPMYFLLLRPPIILGVGSRKYQRKGDFERIPAVAGRSKQLYASILLCYSAALRCFAPGGLLQFGYVQGLIPNLLGTALRYRFGPTNELGAREM